MPGRRFSWDEETDGWGTATTIPETETRLPSWASGGQTPDVSRPYRGTSQPYVDTAPATAAPSWSDPDRRAIGDAYTQYLGRAAGDADFAAHWGNPRGAAGAVQAVKTSPEAQGYATVSKYTAQLDALKAERDPLKVALQRDQLARDLFTDLRQAGHDVSWEGDILVVDGRRYTIADPGAEATGGAGGTGDTSGWDTDGWATPSYVTSSPGSVLAGWEAGHWTDPNMQTPKYVAGRILSQYDPNDPAQVARAVAEIQQAYPGATFDGRDKLTLPGLGTIDIIVGAGAPGATWAWQDLTNAPGTVGPGAGRAVPGQTAGITGTAGAGAVTTTPAGSGTPGATASQAPQGFQGSGTSYVPGEIPFDDITALPSYAEILRAITASGGPVEAATEQALLDLLQSPESLDPRTVAMMKATLKDTLAERASLEEENLLGTAAGMGIEESPWLASERLAGDRARDRAILSGAQALDIEAAKTNLADRREAAKLGAAWAEGKRTTAATAVATAAKAALDTAAVRGDRLTLRETVAQKARELGIQEDELRLDYLVALMNDATDRYGIDVGADLDRAKLAQAGKEFQEDLIFRYAALAQEDRQFGAGYGLDVAKTQHLIDQDYWDRSQSWREAFGG